MVYGWWRVGEYALVDKYDHFTLSLSNLLPLAFPLVTTLLYGLYFSAELTAGGWLYRQLRIGRRRYISRHFFRAGALGFMAAVLMVLCVGVVTLWITPSNNLIQYFPSSGGLPPAQRFTFSQLLEISDVVFLIFYSLWVGFHAALYGICSVIAQIHIGNRLVALALPAIVEFLVDYVLAVLGLENWGMIPAAFPFNLRQGSIFEPVVSTVVFTLVVVGLSLWTLSPKRVHAGFQ